MFYLLQSWWITSFTWNLVPPHLYVTLLFSASLLKSVLAARLTVCSCHVYSLPIPGCLGLPYVPEQTNVCKFSSQTDPQKDYSCSQQGFFSFLHFSVTDLFIISNQLSEKQVNGVHLNWHDRNLRIYIVSVHVPRMNINNMQMWSADRPLCTTSYSHSFRAIFSLINVGLSESPEMH